MINKGIRNNVDCQDFLTGLKLLGTGGGGSIESGREMIEEALDEGLEMTWIDVSELPADKNSCTAFASGSIAEGNPQCDKDIDILANRLGMDNKYGYRAIEIAVHELENYTGKKIGAIVPVELGASNVPAPLITAARMGIPTIDGDYSGRAVPEDMQTTYFLNGINTYPAAIVDWWGDVLIMKTTANTVMGERIGKMLAVAAYGAVYIASLLLNAKQTQKLVIPGTLTRSLELGQTIHSSLIKGADPVHAAVDYLDGWQIFTGEVIGKDWEEKNGVLVGTTHIQGTGEYKRHTMDVFFLNENHIAWLDGKPLVFSPDLIILLDPQTGTGYTNTEIQAGHKVSVIGTRGIDAFRSEKGLKYFGPRYWGFDIDYKPIEETL